MQNHLTINKGKDDENEGICIYTKKRKCICNIYNKRSAGAYGGTIIHAKGTGKEAAEKFMGVSLAAEKEMLFIVSKSEQKNAIMKAIMERAGLATRAKAIVFSVPVTDTAGLRLIEDEEE